MPKKPLAAIHPVYAGSLTEELWNLIDHIAQNNCELDPVHVGFMLDDMHFKLHLPATVSLIGICVNKYSIRIGDDRTTIVYYAPVKS